MQKLPVLEIQLFIQFNKNQIYYVIHDELAYIFMNFQTIQLFQDNSELVGLKEWMKELNKMNVLYRMFYFNSDPSKYEQLTF